MSPERWQKVKEVFHSALEHGPGIRKAFLDKVCGNDAELRAEVESLIASHEEEPGFIELPALHTAGVPLVADAESLAEKMLGP